MACRFFDIGENSDSRVVENESYQLDFPKPSAVFPCPDTRQSFVDNLSNGGLCTIDGFDGFG